MTSRADWVQAAAALFSAVAAAAAWAAVLTTRRERKEERVQRIDDWLVETYRAVSGVVDTLTSGGTHRERQQAQLKLRSLVQIQRSYGLPKTSRLATIEPNAITSELASEAMGEVEAARASLWKEKGKGVPTEADDSK